MEGPRETEMGCRMSRGKGEEKPKWEVEIVEVRAKGNRIGEWGVRDGGRDGDVEGKAKKRNRNG